MRGNFKVTHPDCVGFTLTVVATLREWRIIRKTLGEGVYHTTTEEFQRILDRIIFEAEQSFTASSEPKENANAQEES